MIRAGAREGESAAKDTAPLTEEAMAAIALERREARHISLLVYHRDGMVVTPLRASVGVVVGRDSPSDVRIADDGLSRCHARFTRVDDRVMVEDLESTNGTWVGGQRDRSRRDPSRRRGDRRPGDRLCAHVGTGEERSAWSRGSRALPGAARRRGRAHGVLQPPAGGDDGLRPTAAGGFTSTGGTRRSASACAASTPWRSTARRWPRSSSPRPAARDALALGKVIAGLAIEGERLLRVGIATFPDAARSAEELIELSRAASRRVTSERPVECTPAGPWNLARDIPRGREGDAPIVMSRVMREVFEDAERLSRSVIPILIHGETGTGKEVVARAIHEHSPRRSKPLVYVNCGAIPGSLVENVLFGHERGAYTGADQRQKGLFEAAEGGTVMLDEIGELPPQAQAVLLRVLETKRVMRIGASEEIDVNIRVIAATHRDLEAMCDEGTFRKDLYYRLNAMTVVVPPLRERVEEIEALVNRFLSRASRENDAAVHGITPRALALLQGYSWPGNVRELRNVIERAVVISRSHQVTEGDLPERVRAAALAPTSPPEEKADEAAQGPRHQGAAAEVRAAVDPRRLARLRRQPQGRRGAPPHATSYLRAQDEDAQDQEARLRRRVASGARAGHCTIVQRHLAGHASTRPRQLRAQPRGGGRRGRGRRPSACSGSVDPTPARGRGSRSPSLAGGARA